MWTIAPMTEADVEGVLAIDSSLREAQLREELVRTWARVRVARDETGALAGYVVFWHVADEIHLLNVAVDPSFRRRGAGRRLVEEMLAYARDNGAAKVLLEVRASNVAALALYDGFGFVRFNVREKYYSDGEDGVEMMLDLSS